MGSQGLWMGREHVLKRMSVRLEKIFSELATEVQFTLLLGRKFSEQKVSQNDFLTEGEVLAKNCPPAGELVCNHFSLR